LNYDQMMNAVLDAAVKRLGLSSTGKTGMAGFAQASGM